MKAAILLDHDALEPTEARLERRLVRALVRIEPGEEGSEEEKSGEAGRPLVADLSVEVRPDAGELGVVHHSYPRVSTPDGLRFELGELFPGEARRVLLEFAVAVPSAVGGASTLPVAQVVVAGSVPASRGEGERQEGERQELYLPVTITPGDGPRSDSEVRHELALLAAGRARRDAEAARGMGSIERARRILRRAARRLRRVSERHPEPRRGSRRLLREAGSLEAEAERREGSAWRGTGRPPTSG